MPPEQASRPPKGAPPRPQRGRILPDRHTAARTFRVVSAAIQAWLEHRAASKGALSFYMLFSPSRRSWCW